MNILIPHSWLLEHLETEATPAEIQKYLSLSGPSVERIYDIEGEPVYDIEVTTNRVDCMSVRGIAREAAVILNHNGIKAKLKPDEALPGFITKPVKAKADSLPLPKIINDPKLCKRITAVILTDIARTSSPLWMQTRLKQIGVNVHEAVIDITNYVTHDLGHPCHAFDYDRIMTLGGVIKVTEAHKGQKFTILDGTTYETKDGEVVFENDKGEIIDLPGIKGTANSGVTSATKNVLFWIESVEPKYIRFASMTHAIRTVAAQLNEKGVDSELMPKVLGKGVSLFTMLADAKIVPGSFIDIKSQERKLEPVDVSLAKINAYLGIEVTAKLAAGIMKELGCQVSAKDGALRVTPPSWRPDIAIPVDVIEEIARIWGYHNLPSVLMTGPIPTKYPPETNFNLERDAKALLAALGGNEVYTYSLIGETQASTESQFVLSDSGKHPTDLSKSHLKLKNPLTEDMVYLRRTLWASHLPILTQNPQFVFELANTYVPNTEGSIPTEELHLTLTSNKEVRHLKGILNALVSAIYLPPIRFKVQTHQLTDILVGDIRIGQMLLSANPKLTVIDLDWKVLVLASRKYPMVRPIPKVAPIIEDMTFSFSKLPLCQDVMEQIKAVDPLVEKIEFLSEFKRNLSFRIYYQPAEEMKTTDLSPIRHKILETLQAKYSAQIVGKL